MKNRGSAPRQDPSRSRLGASQTSALSPAPDLLHWARRRGHAHVADFSIRLALLNDVAAINEVFRRSSLSNEGDRVFLLDNPEVLRFDDAPIRAGCTRVAVADGHIVGFATTTVVGEASELDDLFFDPPWMRRGVARALMLDAVSAARAVGSRRIEVTANEHARSFYDAVGFVADGAVETLFAPGTRMHLDIAP